MKGASFATRVALSVAAGLLLAAATIDRFVNAFPAEQQPQIRGLLADSLAGVVAQQLLRTADGKGRAAAHEILIGNFALASLIRESKTAQIGSFIQCILTPMAVLMLAGKLWMEPKPHQPVAAPAS